MNPQEFIAVMAETANNLDFDAHMKLISKEVKVYGVPEFEVVTFDDWHRQCKHEFENKVLKSVSYQGMHIVGETPERITFKSIETVEGNDGHMSANGIEVTIQKEDDDQWRVVQERILSKEELDKDKNSGFL